MKKEDTLKALLDREGLEWDQAWEITTASTGYTFGAWTGACSGTVGATCTIAMSQARTVGAVFTIQTKTLTVTSPSDGTITVPNEAVAVVVNVTYVNANGPGFITLFPSGTPRPNASNLNKVGPGPVPNLVTVKVGAFGAINIYNAQSAVDIIGDLAGYYVVDGSAGGSVPTASARRGREGAHG